MIITKMYIWDRTKLKMAANINTSSGQQCFILHAKLWDFRMLLLLNVFLQLLPGGFGRDGPVTTGRDV